MFKKLLERISVLAKGDKVKYYYSIYDNPKHSSPGINNVPVREAY